MLQSLRILKHPHYNTLGIQFLCGFQESPTESNSPLNSFSPNSIGQSPNPFVGFKNQNQPQISPPSIPFSPNFIGQWPNQRSDRTNDRTIVKVIWVSPQMGKPLFYEVLEKPATSCVIGLCTAIWFYIQKKNLGYSHVGLSYETAVDGHHWRLITSAFSHISVLHLVFNMSALWSLGVVEQSPHLGLGVAFYLHYSLVLVLLSGLLVLATYHLLIHRFKIDYFRRVTAVGYSCVVFGWMTVLAVKQPSSKLSLFGFLSLPISFAPFESLVFTSIIVPQASFVGHLSGIVVGYAIAWGFVHGMNHYWAVSMLGWTLLVFVVSLKQSGAAGLEFLEIEPVTDPALPRATLHMVAPFDAQELV